jgi:hypothetical protein
MSSRQTSWRPHGPIAPLLDLDVDALATCCFKYDLELRTNCRSNEEVNIANREVKRCALVPELLSAICSAGDRKIVGVLFTKGRKFKVFCFVRTLYVSDGWGLRSDMWSIARLSESRL